MLNLHILPDDFERQDFYRMNEVLSALPEEERVQTGADFLAQLGISKDGGASKGI